MGALLGILGDSGDPALRVRMQHMLDCSPHRGGATVHREDGLLLAVQNLGWDASIGRSSGSVVAFHGFVGNLDDLIGDGLTDGAENTAEVLARLYDRDGAVFFTRLRGEFAAVLFDRRRQRLLAARDLVGCRSLFHGRDGGTIVLATEARQVRAGTGRTPELDEDTLLAYLVNQVPEAGASLFKGVGNLLPGRVWSMPARGARRAWTSTPHHYPRPDPALQRLSPQDWAAELARRIDVAVGRCLPDRPFAVTLSGGLDSSTVWGHVAQLRARGEPRAAFGQPISLVFPGRACDESQWIRETLATTGDQGIIVNGDERPARDFFDQIGSRIDTLQFSTTHLVHIISDAAARSDRRVLLSGFFGDHWFDVRPPVGLRPRVREAVIAGSLGSLGQRAGATLVRALVRARHKLPHRKPEWLTPQARRQVVKLRGAEPLTGRSSVERSVRSSLWFEQRSWFVNGWEQVCAISGVEPRHPLADPEVLELALAPPKYFQQRGRGKEALRAAGEGVLTESVRGRQNATIFDELCHPRQWMPEPDWVAERWSLVRRGLVDAGGLDSLTETAYKGDTGAIWLTWLYLFELFARRYESERSCEG